ncbi:MAG: adenosylcobinamide-GDP ribazoletransferase, partial [Bacteroidota bacterium]
MRKEIQIFFTAIMFYTRIPCPSWVDHSEEYLNKATRYFPLIGWIVGGVAALVFLGSSYILPSSIAVMLSMISGVLVTGAFHEDGWADVCDGFGGGWTQEKILKIMKDSVVGAYGVIGVTLMLLMKFMLLWEISKVLPPIQLMVVILAAHSLSRFCAVTMIFSHSYVRENEDSKAKPIAKKLPFDNLIIAGAFGIAPLILFQNPL